MASPTFSRVTFVNGSSPALNATNLNSIQTFLDAISAGGFLCPSGVIQGFAGSSAPTGWLICDGSAISRTTYASLYAVIGTTYGAGDGSTTFNIPDLRETTLVGVGTRGSGVTAHDTYTLGQFKDDQSQGHLHLRRSDGSSEYSGAVGGSFSYGSSGGIGLTLQSATGAPTTDGTNGTPRNGTTTHGKQLGTNWIIKL